MSGLGFTIKFDESKVGFQMLNSDMDISNLDCRENDGTDPDGIHEFIQNNALSHQDHKLGFTHVITYDDTPIGYATIAASRIEHTKMTGERTPKTTLATYPAIIIANLSITKAERGKGFGNYLLLLVLGYCRQKIPERVAARFLILRAKDERISFYTDHGFQVALRQEKESHKLMYIDLFPQFSRYKNRI